MEEVILMRKYNKAPFANKHFLEGWAFKEERGPTFPLTNALRDNPPHILYDRTNYNAAQCHPFSGYPSSMSGNASQVTDQREQRRSLSCNTIISECQITQEEDNLSSVRCQEKIENRITEAGRNDSRGSSQPRADESVDRRWYCESGKHNLRDAKLHKHVGSCTNNKGRKVSTPGLYMKNMESQTGSGRGLTRETTDKCIAKQDSCEQAYIPTVEKWRKDMRREEMKEKAAVRQVNDKTCQRRPQMLTSAMETDSHESRNSRWWTSRDENTSNTSSDNYEAAIQCCLNAVLKQLKNMEEIVRKNKKSKRTKSKP